MTIKNKQRIAVFIDGSNLYFKLKAMEIKNISRFNYRGLIMWLARKRRIVSTVYYIGAVRAKNHDAKGKKLREAQVKLFNFLRSKNQKFLICTGYLMQNGNVYHEKGIDVHLAVDLLIGAYENTYDVAIVISSDTDLIPAIEKVQQLGKGVEYIGFSNQPSFAMQRHATLSRLLIKEDLEQFVFYAHRP